MALDPARLPDDIATLKALLVGEHAARVASDGRAEAAEARALDLDAEIANLKLTIAKMQRQTFGASSERSTKLLDQLELQLAELVEKIAEEKAAAEIAAPSAVPMPEHSKPARRPLPEHLPRERLVHPATTVPVLAKSKCTIARLWAYVRDDTPFAGTAASAALFHYSPNRDGAHPERHLAHYTGWLQADAYAGFNGLYVTGRKPEHIVEAACWAHSRRKFFELAELQKAPIAIEAVNRIDALFAIEREISGRPPDHRLAVRRERSKPLVDDLERWLRDARKKLSSKSPLAKAMDYSLKRWASFTRFLDDGRICMSNNAAERALRGIAVGRRNWTFCGSDAGGQRAAVIYTLIETCKLNDVDPRAWLADVLACIAALSRHRQEWRAGVLAAGARQLVPRPR